jgi:HSP20 family protein
METAAKMAHASGARKPRGTRGISEEEEAQMNAVRWDPFSEFDTLFNRTFPKSFASRPRVGYETGGERLEWSPSADISETEKEYLIRAELPAVKKEDVKVMVDGGMITIQGERKQPKEEKGEKFHRVESCYGNFARSFSLPDNIDLNAIRCEDKDGMLTVHIPKTATEMYQPKQIKVESAPN